MPEFTCAFGALDNGDADPMRLLSLEKNQVDDRLSELVKLRR